MERNTTDLNQTEYGNFLVDNRQQHDYQPRTLPDKKKNGRYAYLPLFPTKSVGIDECLLLANVSISHLSSDEIIRREHGAYISDALMLMNTYNYGNSFSLLQEDVEQLAIRLKVGKAIITFNADRLRTICCTLLALHESFRRNILCMADVALKEPTLNSKQMAIALEFYLQIDVDLFYMKTCSYRGATPYSNTEGLFCGKDQPQARYSILPCGNQLCLCCYPKNSDKKSQTWPVIDFNSSSIHQFVNGYTTYLNCPATCTTSNIVYAMTCPCGDYDYVDSTPETLADAMAYHREHGNRIIHEILTGGVVIQSLTLDSNEQKTTIANKMRLYEHSGQCPAALRTFLDCNPEYWCFVPLRSDEASTDNVSYFNGNPNEDPELVCMMAMNAADIDRVATWLSFVPPPPDGYLFSYRQKRKQRIFFEHLACSSIHQLPYQAIDLYQMAIIAVLPDDRSTILRYIIETLFIIHGETKLNMICPVGTNVELRYGRPYKPDWHINLNRLSMPHTTSNK
ncbi:unnamed protein product [Rotaria sp. Silwood1]|nr:unnamed protein product [Rotaria sp. Silwood1]